MDARLILVLAALLVGTSGATTTKLPALELDGGYGVYVKLPFIYQQYVHLADSMRFSKETDCKQDKFEESWKICTKFKETEREYCEKLAENYKKTHKAECAAAPRAVLTSCIGLGAVREIESFESKLHEYIKDPGFPTEFPIAAQVKMLALHPDRIARLVSLQSACKDYLSGKCDKELSFFEESREETLKRLAKPTGERGLVEAMEDCKFLDWRKTG
jgi:hypothetical protein